MGLEVTLQVAIDHPHLPDQAQFARWAATAWQRADGTAEVVIRIVGEAESRALNARYRRQDRPTNVLSFPYEPLPGVPLHHAGDLVICAPVVEREAVEQGKQAEAHWAHMVVHGLLHLQGHDHGEDAEAECMEALETRIVTGLGYPAPYTTEEMQ